MEPKDLKRIQDIKDRPSHTHIGQAMKMAKLITNPEKAGGRYEAALQVFGSSHEVTKIFGERYLELNGNITVTRKVEVFKELSDVATKMVDHIEEVVVQPVVEAIKRTKEDFPLSRRVRFGEDKGVVVSHEGEEDFIYVLFDGQEKAQDINIYKLKFA